MNIKRNIIFALESRKKDGVLIVENVPIRMRVNFASQRIEFTTGYRIDVAKWDADKQRVKNGCTNKLKQSASEINAALLGYYTELQEVFKRFEVAEVMPSPADVKNAFNARYSLAMYKRNQPPMRPILQMTFIRPLMSSYVSVVDRTTGHTLPTRSSLR